MTSKRYWIAFFMLILSLTISSCGPGELLGPGFTATPRLTATRTPTVTRTPTRTPSPTATLDPFNGALDKAKQLRTAKNYTDALAAYTMMLKQFSTGNHDLKQVHEGIYAVAVEALATADKQEKERKSRPEYLAACKTYQQAYAAYEILLTSSSNLKNDQPQFYTDAARNYAKVADCHLGAESPLSYQEVIDLLVTGLGFYPDTHPAKNLLIQAILNTYQSMVYQENIKNPQAVITTGKALLGKIGNYTLDGQKIADVINAKLAIAEICTGKPVTSSNIATSPVKKVINCYGLRIPFEEAGLYTTNPAEMWYLMEQSSETSKTLQCTSKNTSTAKSFTYSYPGQSDEIITLRNVRTGAIVATKRFEATQPRCVFTSCSLNTMTNTASCVGGEGHSGYSQAALIQWLKDNVR